MNTKRILIAHPEAACLTSLASTLTGAGYEVLVAKDGAEAVSTARQCRPGLILLADRFPRDPTGGVVWDGCLLLDWLRRLEETCDIPVILTSDNPALQEQARAAGFFAFFPKPINTEGLLDVLQQKLPAALVSRETESKWEAARA